MADLAHHSASDDDEFDAFVRQHARDVSRLAYLLTGDHDETDDITADVMVEAWRRWAFIQQVEQPKAYLRRMTANMAASRIRRLRVARAKLVLFRSEAEDVGREPDGAGVDVQRALSRLPQRRRACVVLRLAFDMSERETAETLGISVGTVKSQTSKGVSRLRQLLEPGDPDTAAILDLTASEDRASAEARSPRSSDQSESQ